jgi:hypothetical protein
VSISSDWLEFEHNVLPTDFGVESRRKAKFAYYTGASSILDRLLTASSEPGADIVAFISNARIELQAMANSIAVEASQGRQL